jgi:hypothetical protein
MAKYLTVALLSLWVVLTFTVGVPVLTGVSLGEIRSAVRADTLVRPPTFDLLPLADF